MERTARSGAAGRPQGNRDTADACLAEAERLFAAQGFAGTGMRDIAGRSGVTVATLAYHFGSKEKLYGRVLGRVAESIGAYLPEVETVAPEPAAVAEALAGFLDWALDHPDYAALLLRELMENPERAPQAKRWYLAPVIRAYAAVLQRGQAAGRLADCDAEMLVFYVTGAITHFCAARPTLQRMLAMPDRATLALRFRATLLQGLVAQLTPGAG